jgi:hypothetical protein
MNRMGAGEDFGIAWTPGLSTLEVFGDELCGQGVVARGGGSRDAIGWDMGGEALAGSKLVVGERWSCLI